MTRAHGALLWAFFVVVHAILVTENLVAPNGPLGDVQNTYPLWWSQAMAGYGLPGLTTTGVYPFLSLAPIAVAAAGVGAWFTMVIALDAVALAVVARRSPLAGWVWLGFQVALGPIAVGRIDAVTVALAVIAVTVLDRSPRTAGVLVAIATWVKVWPVALGVAAIRSPRFGVFARWSFLSALAIAAVGVIVGDHLAVFSFLSEQQGRGIQVESVAATPWLWDSFAGGDSTIAFSPSIYTFEVDGHGIALMAKLLTVVQVAVALGIVALLLSHRRTVGSVTPATFGYALLALVALLVAVNKVGSPQFVSWFAVPIVAIVLAREPRGSSALLAITGSIAVLTHLVYPYVYFRFLELQTIPLVLITVRNLLEVVLFVTALVVLVTHLRLEKALHQGADLNVGDEESVVPVR